MRVNLDDLEAWHTDGGGVISFKYQGAPFTGTVEKYYKSGKLLTELEYVDGYQEGWHRSYHENGQLAIEENIHNNETIDGTYKEYDESGILIFEI